MLKHPLWQTSKIPTNNNYCKNKVKMLIFMPVNGYCSDDVFDFFTHNLVMLLI